MINCFTRFVSFLVMILMVTLPVHAETPAVPDVSTEDLSALVELLEDDVQREEFVARLKALQTLSVDAQEESPGLGTAVMEQVLDRLQVIGALVSEVSGHLASPGILLEEIAVLIETPDQQAFWSSLGLSALIALGIGLLVRQGLIILLTASRRRVEQREPANVLDRLFWLSIRTMLDVAPLLGFGLAAYAVLAVLDPEPLQRIVIVTLVNAVVVARALIAVTRLTMTPLAPNLRLFRLSDRVAVYLFVWIKRFINVTVYGYFAVQVSVLLESPPAVTALIAHVTALLALLMTLMLIIQNRRILADMDTTAFGDSQTRHFVDRMIGTLADVWHIPAILYALTVYAIWAVGQEDGFLFLIQATIGTFVALAIARLLLIGIEHLTRRLFRVNPQISARFPGIDRRANRYQPIVRLVLSLMVAAITLLALLEVWGLDVTGLLASDGGRDVLGRVIRITLIAAVAIAVIEVTHLAIARYLNQADGAGTPIARSSRIKTILPLARSAVAVVIGLVASLTILSELGIDIGPILAGAGVLGLAVGFGAQTLVKDVITGVFILMEDSISVGDVVSVAGHSGTVEALSVRSIRLRDLKGTVHTVPFSAVDSVENLTKDYSYYLLDVGVAYRENTDDVISVLEAIDKDFQQDPGVRDDVLEPLEIMGVNTLADSAVVIRARLKTRPGQQWRIGREFNRRIKLVFDDLGIEIPFPHQTIYFGEGKDGTAPSLYIERVRQEPGEDGDNSGPEAPSLEDRVKGMTARRGRSSDAEASNEPGGDA